VQGVARQDELLRQVRIPAFFHPLKVFGAVARVELVAGDGEAAFGEMDADLVHPSGFGKTAHQRELHAVP
jgi:hypothetical protein